MLDKLVNLYDEFTKGGRIQSLGQLAKEYGFHFQKYAPFVQQRSELKIFKAFSKKGMKRMLGVLALNSEQFKGTVRFYDYTWTKDLETKRHSVVEIVCDEIFTEYTLIEPKGAFAKMKGFFVSGEKQFSGIDDFYKNFQISSKGETEALWLNPNALQLMANHPGLTMEAEGSNFIFYYWKKEIKIPDVIPIIDFAEEFVRLTCHDYTGDFV